MNYSPGQAVLYFNPSIMNDSGSVMHLKGWEDEVYAWIEHGSSVMLKANTSQGDPVELTAEDARELGSMLMKAAERLDHT